MKHQQQILQAASSSTPGASGSQFHVDSRLPEHPGDLIVLVVDDQPRELRTLARFLKKERFQVLTAICGQDAIDILNLQTVHVVIADHHMPEMTGTELLKLTAQEYPNTVRIMLTGETGVVTLLPAVNSGTIDKLLTKPWTPKSILSSINDIARLRRLEIDNDNLNETLRLRNEELRELNHHLEARIEDKAKALIRAIHYDAVTGLPNRDLVADRLIQTLNYARRVKQPVAIVMLGIDRLKIINNTLGHHAGNELLCTFADWLRSECSDNDVVARIEGDEFAVVIHGINTTDKLENLTRHLVERLSNPFLISQREIYMTVSSGISLFPGDAGTVDELFRAAGWAMQSAREAGGDCCKYFSDQPNDSAQSRLNLETGLRNALKREEFILHYQPRVKADNGHVLGAEALVRWQHPQRGIVLPGEFISLLEQTGLINNLGDWVMTEACLALKRWQDVGHKRFRLSVNISPIQIATGNLYESILQALEISQVDLSQGQLELEITESTLMLNDHNALDVLRRIHDLGVRIAIDDFGTGYSALSYLTRFPIDVLKIDRSFVAQISHRIEDSQMPDSGNALVQAILNISRGLRLTTVAEGVETRGQWEFLRACQCDELQGFLFSMPVPESAFLKFFSPIQSLPIERSRPRPRLPD